MTCPFETRTRVPVYPGIPGLGYGYPGHRARADRVRAAPHGFTIYRHLLTHNTFIFLQLVKVTDRAAIVTADAETRVVKPSA
ncbi:hypothetical protein FCM35_KLT18428 [Carex littledalei]|uniref:Uncharacterized protein n=1 Tax=Carex littledalei TaxID=544730 RepID=A0A833VGH6_9POAL|nr:hypothetical protein FCM35_KLT18428 [Carex littledalei]